MSDITIGDWDNQKWDYALKWMEKNKPFVKKIFREHGWKRDDDIDDVNQELLVFVVEQLDKEKQLNPEFNPEMMNEHELAYFCVSVQGSYRKKAWRDRSAHAIRKKDLWYSDYDNSDDLNSRVETCDINVYNSELAAYNYDYPDIIDKSRNFNKVISDSEQHAIYEQLLRILSSSARQAIEMYVNDETAGVLTHNDIANKLHTTRSNVSKMIASAKKNLKHFLDKNHISYDMLMNPNEDTLNYIKKAVHDYLDSLFVGKKIVKNSQDSINIETYLASVGALVMSNYRLYLDNKIEKDRYLAEVQNIQAYQRQHEKDITQYHLSVLSIEDYLSVIN